MSDRMSYITLRGRWYGSFLNVHALTEDKSVDMNDSFHDELYLNQSPQHPMNILLDVVGKGNVSNPTIGTTHRYVFTQIKFHDCL
jgi:hypothetical protein